jgi:glutaredoxin-like protein NrdH
MTVMLYTRPGCPDCDAARRYLDESEAAYEERDITKDPAAEEELAEITGGPLAVPVTVEDGEVRVGFPYA